MHVVQPRAERVTSATPTATGEPIPPAPTLLDEFLLQIQAIGRPTSARVRLRWKREGKELVGQEQFEHEVNDRSLAPVRAFRSRRPLGRSVHPEELAPGKVITNLAQHSNIKVFVGTDGNFDAEPDRPSGLWVPEMDTRENREDMFTCLLAL